MGHDKKSGEVLVVGLAAALVVFGVAVFVAFVQALSGWAIVAMAVTTIAPR